jgi:hypothetical protein
VVQVTKGVPESLQPLRLTFAIEMRAIPSSLGGSRVITPSLNNFFLDNTSSFRCSFIIALADPVRDNGVHPPLQ